MLHHVLVVSVAYWWSACICVCVLRLPLFWSWYQDHGNHHLEWVHLLEIGFRDRTFVPMNKQITAWIAAHPVRWKKFWLLFSHCLLKKYIKQAHAFGCLSKNEWSKFSNPTVFFFRVDFSFPSFAPLLLLSIEVVEMEVVPPSSAVACKPYSTPDKFSILGCTILFVENPGFVTKIQEPACKLQYSTWWNWYCLAMCPHFGDQLAFPCTDIHIPSLRKPVTLVAV